ncbi:hypothetical protein EMIT0111MI5_10674 [Burkholderia sp. IT-111MI5]
MGHVSAVFHQRNTSPVGRRGRTRCGMRFLAFARPAAAGTGRRAWRSPGAQTKLESICNVRESRHD